MSRRTRSGLRASPFLKFLKPGALARLRDSRIITTSKSLHRINSLSQIRSTPPISPSGDSALPQFTVAADGFPSFSAGIYGPRFPQRKKLVAGKSVMFLSDSPDSIIDLFSTDALTAR